jgi:allantoinase
MVHSGIDDFPHVSEADIRLALKTLREKGDNGVYMFHAENPEVIDSCARLGGDPRQYRTFLNSRPKSAEDKAIDTVITLLKEQPYQAHIVHLASSSALDMIANAKRAGLPISAETTYHYLHFEAEKIPDGNTLYKCCPPIRELDNREKLWNALRNGVITQVVSDHSPCTVNLKRLDTGDFMQAWGGISSLQLGLPIVWTGAKQRGLSVADVSRFCSKQTSQLVNLGRKGSIEVGKDADFVVWDPNASFFVTKDILHFKNKPSPYEGQKLFGVVKATILRGQKIVDNSKFVNENPVGEWVKRDSKKFSKI